MFFKECFKCGKDFITKKREQRFCCKSCSNSYTTSLRKIEDKSIFCHGIDSTSAYILGIIFSDGCISFDRHSKRMRITIAMNEKELMTKINYLMTPTKKLYEYKHPKGCEKTYSVISTNPIDIKYLLDIGLTERKSSTISMPNIPAVLVRHFIRGYFDGDGSVYINNTKTKYRGSISQYFYVNASFTTGSEIFAKELKNVLNDYSINSHIV